MAVPDAIPEPSPHLLPVRYAASLIGSNKAQRHLGRSNLNLRCQVSATARTVISSTRSSTLPCTRVSYPDIHFSAKLSLYSTRRLDPRTSLPLPIRVHHLPAAAYTFHRQVEATSPIHGCMTSDGSSTSSLTLRSTTSTPPFVSPQTSTSEILTFSTTLQPILTDRRTSAMVFTVNLSQEPNCGCETPHLQASGSRTVGNEDPLSLRSSLGLIIKRGLSFWILFGKDRSLDHVKGRWLKMTVGIPVSSGNLSERLVVMDMEYRYWAFLESHPAHVSLPQNARAEAMDVLTWSWTGMSEFIATFTY